MRFWLNEGGMHHETVDPSREDAKRRLPDRYPRGSIIAKPDEVEWDKLFPGKWKEVKDPRGTPMLPPAPAEMIQPMIPGGVIGQKVPPKPMKMPPADDPAPMEAPKAEVVAPEAPSKAKKGKKKHKGKAEPADMDVVTAADEAALASVEPEDVTLDYKIAGKNGLKVFMLPGGKGYNVTEEDSPETPINKKPLKLDAIEKYIEGYIEDDE